MDPLSGAASVIAVVQLAAAITQICGTYLNKVKDAKRDIQRFQKEVIALSCVLQSLHELLHGPNSAKITAAEDLVNNITTCSSTLTKLKEKIEPETMQRRMRRWGLRAFKWPLNRSEVDDAISEIERYKTMFNLSLLVDQMTSTNRIDQKIGLGRLQIAKGAAFDSYDNQHAECLLGTRVDLLQEVEDWAKSPDGKCIFWLNGMAGTGKSTISRTAAGCLKQQHLLGASFFFKRGEEDRGTAKKFFPTLVEQLVTSIPHMLPKVQEAIEDDPHISDKVLREQFEKLLLEPLLRIEQSEGMKTRVIVIDALDECDSEDDMRVILRLLPRVQKSTSMRLRFLLTSRPELPIRLGFTEITDTHHELALHEIPTPVIEHDISLYFEDQFFHLRQDRSFPPDWPGDTTVKILIERAIPLFIAAATLCRFIGDPKWNPKKRLEAILTDQSVYVSKMDSTYIPVLKQLLTGQDEEESKQILEDFKEIVGAVVNLATPLSINALSQLLDRGRDDLKLTIRRLESLIQGDKYSEISGFLYDARRFVLKNRQIADSAPLQLYSSGLIFAPKGSTIRKQFHSELAAWDRLPQVEENWSAELLTLEGHSKWVQSVAFSTDGLLVSSSHDNGIKLWDPSTGDLRQTLKGHSESVQSVAFSPDGQLLASGSNDKTIRLWDASTGDLRQTLEGHSSSIRSVAFSPNGQLLASGSDDTTVRLWDPSMGNLCWILDGHLDTVLSVAFSPDGQLLASGSNDGTLRLWDPCTSDLRQTLKDDFGSVLSVAFSPDGQLLASGSDDMTVRLWDSSTGDLLQILAGHSNWDQSVVFSPDGQLLGYGSTCRGISFWDFGTGEQHNIPEVNPESVLSVTFSPDGQLLASGSDDKTIRLWDLSTGDLRQTLEGHSSSVWSVAFSPNGQLLASSSDDTTVRLWDPTTADLHQTLEVNSESVLSVIFSPDGQLLASGSDDTTVRLWDPSTGDLRQTLKGHSESVQSVAFSPDGQLLASGSDDTTVRLWDLSTGDLRQTLKGHSSSIQSVAFSPNGELLASGSGDKTIRLWDPNKGDLCQVLEGPSWVWSVAFSSDGQLLASGFDDKIIRLWDLSTGDLRQTLKGHFEPVWSESNIQLSILESQWICFRGRRVLWLPPHYRPTCLAFRAGMVGLGHSSGRVSFISHFA
ncbi:uncharacterized protein ACHE_10123A [Aspergillus chevalieri]|uniref:NACHT domain-containing protein n=1 Tax=Aspergillus chevalieri TaxID=182096 RepID=A0A7R7VDJ0_ASPCH|nr:uncharacterized protein ACHE_10123A [Aspergillus chevalieri]BCR82721.1 hypothetical protein ACHE_10123A [Aspergillus chevalieri]